MLFRSNGQPAPQQQPRPPAEPASEEDDPVVDYEEDPDEAQDQLMEEPVEETTATVTAPVAKRHKKKEPYGFAGVQKNWKRSRVRALMQQGGVVRMTKQAVQVSSVLLQALMDEGIRGTLLYAGMYDGSKRKTIRREDVIEGFKQTLGHTLYT